MTLEASERVGGRAISSSGGNELGGTYLNNSLALPLIEEYQRTTMVSGGESSHPGKDTVVWSYQGKRFG
jgi:monoamine oxidase